MKSNPCQVQILDSTSALGVVQPRILKFCMDESRTDGIDSYAEFSVIHRHRSGHRNNSSLGGRVGIVPALADQGIDRRSVDDDSFARLHHMRQHVLATKILTL